MNFPGSHYPVSITLAQDQAQIIIIISGLGEGCPNFKLPERDKIQIYRERKLLNLHSL